MTSTPRRWIALHETGVFRPGCFGAVCGFSDGTGKLNACGPGHPGATSRIMNRLRPQISTVKR